jgi:hypothetical protein
MAVLSGFCLWSCVVGDSENTTTLRLVLPDSWDAKFGKFDRVEINILDSTGKVTQAKIFSEPYNKDVDSVRLTRLLLVSPVPEPMTVRIIGFKGGDSLYAYEISIVNREATTHPVVYVGPDIEPNDSVDVPAVRPTSISLLIPTPMILFPGGSPGHFGCDHLTGGQGFALESGPDDDHRKIACGPRHYHLLYGQCDSSRQGGRDQHPP